MSTQNETSSKVLIIGGGTGGITVAAQLLRQHNPPKVTIIEPAEEHFYQPLWTLVGAGIVSREASRKMEREFIPTGVEWIRERVATIDPATHTVTCEGGRVVTYQQLVVAAGIQIDWNAIPGLVESVGKPGTGVVSNYSYDTVNATWDAIRNFRGGTALFTDPKTAVKCGGAPQKIMYLAEEAFRKQGVREKTKVLFMNGKPVNFTAPSYAGTFRQICADRDIAINLQTDLIRLRPDTKEAVFATPDGERVEKYDLIHVTPPQSAPDFLKASPLGDAAGWVDVNKETLQHTRYPDVFGIGDCTNLPTSKTGAAIRSQAPVLVSNLTALRDGATLAGKYDGYTACPVVTGYGSLVMAEFDYAKLPAESMPFDQNRERYSMYALKTYMLPQMYWHGMLRGRL